MPSPVTYLVLGGWRGVPRWAARARDGGWELSDRAEAWTTTNLAEARRIAVLVAGLVVQA